MFFTVRVEFFILNVEHCIVEVVKFICKKEILILTIWGFVFAFLHCVFEM